MATGIVLTVAEKLYAALHSQELRDVCSMFGYESQLDDLKVTVSTIKCVLLDAESKHQDLTHEGREYIERLKEAVYDVDDLLDEFNTMVQKNKLIKGGKSSKKVRRFFSRSNQVLVAFNMSREIKNLRSKLDKIAKDRQQFGFTDVYVPIKRKPETISFVGEDTIIGREDEREAIVELLLGDSESCNLVGHKVSYVTIVGIGGLGKTALAQLVYNDNRVQKAFELRLWVCVSDDFVLEKMFRLMLGRDVFNIEDLQKQVRNLIEGKRYLLVLDDVWNESRDEWDRLKSFLDLGRRGSRIVVTSRSKKVARVVGDDLMYELKGLSEENSWNLFKRLAFEQGKEPTNTTDHLFDIGKEIVKKCANVPLAIRVAASMLYDEDERKWISLKDANLMEMGLGENGVMPMLKYSYCHLTPALKSCFSLCALFPKDAYIDKELLVRLWLAQGYLDQPSDYQNEEDVGDEYYSILLQRCFLQDGLEDVYGEIVTCKMHDLIHDLSQEVAGKETILLDSARGQFDKRNIHLSFANDGLGLLTSPITQLNEMKRLRTCLTLPEGKNPLDLIESNVLTICSHLKRLRSLDLCGVSFNTLPDIVGNLSHLRDLNLSGNSELTVIPNSITKLYNLQVLNLDNTYVRELPSEMRKLVNLRHLSLRGCFYLTHMPPGLNTLTSLRSLTTFVVGNESSDQGNIGKLRDLSALVNLRGELDIIFKYNSSCDVANYRQVELLRTCPLKKMTIQFRNQGAIDESLLDCLRPHSRLKGIEIGYYKAFKLPSWAETLSSSLPNLVIIHLVNFESLEILPSLSQLRYLKCLELQVMTNVEFMENEVVIGPSDDELLFFPSLEELVLDRFLNLKGWWKEEISGVTREVDSSSAVVPFFPSLRRLSLNNCPNLTNFPSCPNLVNLSLYQCHEALTLFGNKRAVSGHPTTTGPSSSLSSGPLLYMNKVRTDSIGRLDCLFGKLLRGINYLRICCFEGESLSTLVENCVAHASIKELEIYLCSRLVSLSGVEHLTCLESLCITHCHNLELVNNEEGATMKPWKSLHLLSHLSFDSLPKLIILPKELQYLTALQSLSIDNCENLETLPEWINCLTSLQILDIKKCNKLKSLPEAITHLSTLEILTIHDCENLEGRCHQPDGEDWPKIRHIPRLDVEWSK